MLRKAAPVVLMMACGLFVAAAVWAQDGGTTRSQDAGAMGSIRNFFLGDDEDSLPARQPRRGDTRAGERPANDNRSQTDNRNQADDDSDNPPPSSMQQRQRQQTQYQSQMPKNDNPWDKRFHSNGPSFSASDNSPSSSNSSNTSSNNRKQQARSEAPTYQPYQYSGQYADRGGDGSSDDNSASTNRRTAQAKPSPRIDPSAALSSIDSDENAGSSTGGQPRPATITNPHVAQNIATSDRLNQPGTPSQGPRSPRSLQDKLTAVQVAADEPPVRVPDPDAVSSKPTQPTSRRTTGGKPVAQSTDSSNSANSTFGPPPTVVAAQPKEPTSRVSNSANNSSASQATQVPAMPVPVAKTSGPTSRRVPVPEATQPVAVQPAPTQPVASQPAPQPVAAKPKALVADSRAAAKAEVPVDNVLFSHQSPLLSVETTGPKTISVGKEATYTITMQNAGEVAAPDVVVSIKVPEWADVVGAKTSTGTTQAASQPGDAYQWRMTSLAGHGREQLALRLVPRQSRPFDLAVQWTFSPIASQTIVEVQEPKLTLDIVGPKEVGYGQTKVFRLTLANPGTGDAENVIIRLLPLGDRKDTGASHQLGTLPAGESKVIEVELTARETGSLNIRAEAVADGGLKAEVTDQVLVRRAGLQLDVDSPKVKYAGTPATFVVHVANPGNANAESVQINAKLPTGAKFISASGGGQLTPDQGSVAWTMGTLRPGSEASLEIKCLLTTPGANNLQVVSTAADELSASGGSTTQVEALADLKLEIVDPQGPVAVGEEAVYEVHVKNRGTKTAEQIEVVSYFSAGLEPVAAAGAQFEIARGQVSFAPIATLQPGNELVLKVRASADKPGSHVFRTEVVCRTLESKLASEVTTRFYGDEAPASEAKQPTQAVRRTEAIVPLPKSEQQPRPFPTEN